MISIRQQDLTFCSYWLLLLAGKSGFINNKFFNRVMFIHISGFSLLCSFYNCSRSLFCAKMSLYVILIHAFDSLFGGDIRSSERGYLLFVQYVHSLQKKYSLSSFSLLGHTAPVQAASLLILGPFLDFWLTGRRVDNFDYNVTSVVSFETHCFFHHYRSAFIL